MGRLRRGCASAPEAVSTWPGGAPGPAWASLALPGAASASVAATPADAYPATNCAISARGRTVAEMAMRCTGDSARRSTRSTAVTRCVPRLLPATAWISSRMTFCTVSRSVRPLVLVRSMLRLSGVVIRISGGCRSMPRRSSAGVSPLRVKARISGGLWPSARKRSVSSVRGWRRLR